MEPREAKDVHPAENARQGVIILRSRARSAALPWIQFFKLQ